MKKKFREMQTQMQDPVNHQNGFSTQTNAGEKSASKKRQEDYIDFEEVK